MPSGFSIEGKAQQPFTLCNRSPSPCPQLSHQTHPNQKPQDFFEAVSLGGVPSQDRSSSIRSAQQHTLRLTIPPRPPEVLLNEILASAKPSLGSHEPTKPREADQIITQISDNDKFILEGEQTKADLFLPPETIPPLTGHNPETTVTQTPQPLPGKYTPHPTSDTTNSHPRV